MPRKSFKSRKFDYLYKHPERSRYWQYRRYAPERDLTFSFSTGEEKNEKVAHELGEAAYHKWLILDLGEEAQHQGIRFGAFAQAHLDRKLARPLSDFKRNSRNTSKSCTGHLIRAFGHLRIDQVNEDRWEDYINELSEDGEPPKFYNRRKELREIMTRAHRNGLIKRLPEFRNPDPKTDAGRALKDWEVDAIISAASPDTALLVELLWRQGPRPREALQYEWPMIDWSEGEFGTIAIPGRITKTERSRTIPLNSVISTKLKERQKTSQSRFIFPSPDCHKGADFPIVEYKGGWDGALTRAQAKQLEDEGPAIAHAVIYDLRRTFITNCARRGKPILWVAKYTDTSVKMIERFYAKMGHDTLKGVAE